MRREGHLAESNASIMNYDADHHARDKRDPNLFVNHHKNLERNIGLILICKHLNEESPF
jgi:hypothetical protein